MLDSEKNNYNSKIKSYRKDIHLHCRTCSKSINHRLNKTYRISYRKYLYRLTNILFVYDLSVD